MIITLHRGADLEGVKKRLAAKGLWIDRTETSTSGAVHLVAASSSARVDAAEIAGLEGVADVTVGTSGHPKIDAQGPRVMVGDLAIDARAPVVIAGPCSVESETQIHRIAKALAERRVKILRGGAFKPRTSPYSFQGRGNEALGWLRRAADANGMKVVTEVMSELDVGAVAEHADIAQIGSRNMHNYALLKAVGRTGKPVLLKRSMAATIDEWLLAAEYLLVHGAGGVVLCERGIRSFDDSTRNLIDLGAVALLAHVSKLPVIVDPSHATGRRELIVPLAKAALAAGAAGVMIETHDAPGEAESDAAQALPPSAVAAVQTFIEAGAR